MFCSFAFSFFDTPTILGALC